MNTNTSLATIRIINLRLRTFIGFNPEELTKQQDVVINVEIQYPADHAVESDQKDDALNYKTVTKSMIAFVESGKFKLLEALTGGLLEIACEHPVVKYAQVTVEKPHALRFADSVSLTLSKQID